MDKKKKKDFHFEFYNVPLVDGISFLPDALVASLKAMAYALNADSDLSY